MLMFTKKNRDSVDTVQPKRQGFTIVELIVVISVIGILASIGLVSYASSQNRAKRVSYDTTAQQAKLKLAEYYTDNNKYPVNTTVALQYFEDTGSASLKKTIVDSGAYTYVATTTTGGVCSDASRNCQTYTLTVPATYWSGPVSDNIIVRP